MNKLNAKQKYRGMFETQKSGNKTSLNVNYGNMNWVDTFFLFFYFLAQ